MYRDVFFHPIFEVCSCMCMICGDGAGVGL